MENGMLVEEETIVKYYQEKEGGMRTKKGRKS